MEIDRYQQMVLAGGGLDSTLERRVLGLCAEAGEVAEELQKAGRPGRELRVENLLDELGDVQWYVAAIAGINGVTLTELADRNIAKLRLRYPNAYPEEANASPRG